MKGKIKFFNKYKNFGFIAGNDKRDYFVHVTGLLDKEILLKEDGIVEFSTESTERGLKAVDVRVVKDEKLS